MDITILISIVTILITLSIASERLVEIIKGFLPHLSKENLVGAEEAWRKTKLSLLALICGIVTAFLASPILSGILKDVFPKDTTCELNFAFLNLGNTTACGFDLSANGIFLIVALGLLASGGSSLWNSILEYLLKIKDLKKIEVNKREGLRKIEIDKAEIELETARTKMNRAKSE